MAHPAPLEPRQAEPAPGPQPARPAALGGALALPLAPARVLALQRSAGNRAVTGLLQREPLTFDMCREDDTAESVTTRWVEKNRYRLTDLALHGLMSRGEAVDLLRTSQPLVRPLPPDQVARMLSANFLQLPEHRLKPTAEGIAAEMSAALRNIGGLSLPTVAVKGEAGELRLSADGAIAQTKIGGAKVSVGATPGGPEGKVEGGGVEGKVKSDYEGSKVEVSIGAGKAELSGSLEKQGDEWSKWRLTFTLQVAGPKVAPVPELQTAVGKAHEAIGSLAGHLAGGGNPADAKVKQWLEDVKDAMEKLSEATKRREKEIGVTIEGWAGSTETEVPGGGTVKGTGAGVGVRISF
jgi:hypothetical protein